MLLTSGRRHLDPKVTSLSLNLDRSPVLLDGSGGNHQVTPRALVFATHQLTDRPDRGDDRRTRRIRHERLQWLERAAHGRFARQRQYVMLARLEPGDRGLHYLHQALVRQRNAGELFFLVATRRREPQLRRLSREREWSQVLSPSLVGRYRRCRIAALAFRGN